jgi:hypothetical protein
MLHKGMCWFGLGKRRVRVKLLPVHEEVVFPQLGEVADVSVILFFEFCHVSLKEAGYSFTW